MSLDRIRPRVLDAILAAACAVASLWVYRPALGAYFSPDDLILLERAQGLAPRLSTAWRFLSGRAYFDLVAPWFGTDPAPYLRVNWLLHGLAVVLLYAWARRHGGPLAATVAAGCFGASRLFLTVVSQVVGVGELLSLILTLAACLLLTARRPAWRVAATPVFVAALLCKETVALVPLALVFSPPMGDALPARVRRVAPLLAVSLAFVALLVWTGVAQTAFGGRAYETRLGLNLVPALVTYAAWSVNLNTLILDYHGSTTQVPWGTGLAVLATWIALAWWTRRRTAAPALGAAWWLMGLVPVLPLLWQRYLHYLYVPSAGLALALGGTAEWALARRARRTAESRRRPEPARRQAPRARAVPARAPSRVWAVAAWTVVAAALLAHAALSSELIRRRLEARLSYADIPLDPFVRKMELARRVATRVRAALGDRPARAVFYVPDQGDNRFFANLLQSVLDHGRGLRAVSPNLDSVAFVARWSPAYRDFELFAGSLDGFVDHLGQGPPSHLALARTLERFGMLPQAAEHLKAACRAFPSDPSLHLARARAEVRRGRHADAAAACRRALDLGREGAVADSARAILRRIGALDGSASRH